MATLPEYAVQQIVQGHLDAASFAYERIGNAGVEAEAERTRPSFLLRPALSIDGDKWCALYGENLQDGVAGFGDSPAAAFADFDRAWHANLAPRAAPEGGPR